MQTIFNFSSPFLKFFIIWNWKYRKYIIKLLIFTHYSVKAFRNVEELFPFIRPWKWKKWDYIYLFLLRLNGYNPVCNIATKHYYWCHIMLYLCSLSPVFWNSLYQGQICLISVRILKLNDFFSAVYEAIGCGQKIITLVWRCHQLLFVFLACRHFPRFLRQPRLSANIKSDNEVKPGPVHRSPDK